MPTRCRICDKDIDSMEMAYCRYCKTPYHLDCIKSHLYHNEGCPNCGRLTRLAHYRRGVPDGIIPLQTSKSAEYRFTEGHVAPIPGRAARDQERATVPKGKKTPGGGRMLLLINFIIITLLLASTHYAHTTYVEYGPGLFVDEDHILVTPGQSAEFTVNLHNPGNILSRYRIYIDEDGVEIPAGWQIALIDDEGAFENNYIEKPVNPGGEYQFTAKVYTNGVNADSQGSFRVMAITKDGKYYASELLSVATESQYIYNYELSQDNTQKYVSGGETAQFSATIKNNGSDSDTYHVKLESITPGWNASLMQQQVTIGANLSEQITLTMTAPNDAEGNQKGDVVIKVSSQNETEDTKTAKFTLVINPSYAFDIVSSEVSKDVLPGTTTNFTFKLVNQGNLTDTYYLATRPTMPTGWEYAITKDQVTLASGSQITIGLSITVPEGSAGELEGIVDLDLQSEGSGESETMKFSVKTMEDQEKYILVELFTSVNCDYCPAAENAIEDVIEDYPGKIIVLEHHLNDSLSSEISSQRGMKYTIGGYPIAIFDGVKKDSGGTSETYNKYVRIIDQLVDEELLVRINLTVSESITNPELFTVTALIKSEGLGSNVPLDILFVAYRNGVSPIGYNSRIYDHVSVKGLKSTISSLDSVETISVTMDIPEDGGVVVFVQDSSTNKVYQCVMI